MLGSVIKTLKISPTITVSVCYQISQQAVDFRFGQILQCWKCNILVITQALVLCLIYMQLPLGAVRPWALCVFIRQSTLACVKTYTYGMLASPCCMRGSLAFGCVLLCKSALGLYYLCPSHQLKAVFAPDSNSHMKMLSKQWHKS